MHRINIFSFHARLLILFTITSSLVHSLFLCIFSFSSYFLNTTLSAASPRVSFKTDLQNYYFFFKLVTPCKLIYRCPRRNVPDFGRVFLMLKYTDITQNTYVQSWTVTEKMARQKCGLLAGPRTVPVSWHSYPCPSLSVVSYDGSSAHASPKLHMYFLQGGNVVHVVAALWMVGRLVVRSC